MIRAIIFDFGDVFINLDKPATLRELEKWNVKDFSERLSEINQEYEKGLISSEDFISSFQEHYSHLKDSDITNSWNAMLLDFPEYRLDFLKKLSEENKYKLILLSNTNDIHIDWVKENIPHFEEFRNCFDAFYLSQQINLRKPDASIFEFVLKENRLESQEVLFIDDTKENTDAAAALGIHTWNIDPATEDVVDLFTVKKELF